MVFFENVLDVRREVDVDMYNSEFYDDIYVFNIKRFCI